jgi:hypothetical protein
MDRVLAGIEKRGRVGRWWASKVGKGRRKGGDAGGEEGEREDSAEAWKMGERPAYDASRVDCLQEAIAPS